MIEGLKGSDQELARIGRAGRHAYVGISKTDRATGGSDTKDATALASLLSIGAGPLAMGNRVEVSRCLLHRPATRVRAWKQWVWWATKKVSLAATGLGGRVQGSKSKRSVDEGASLEGRSSVSECQSVGVVPVGQEGRVRSQVPTEEGGVLGLLPTCSREPMTLGWRGFHDIQGDRGREGFSPHRHFLFPTSLSSRQNFNVPMCRLGSVPSGTAHAAQTEPKTTALPPRHMSCTRLLRLHGRHGSPHIFFGYFIPSPTSSPRHILS